MSQQEFPKVTFHFSSEYQVGLQRYYRSEEALSRIVSQGLLFDKPIAPSFIGD